MRTPVARPILKKPRNGVRGMADLKHPPASTQKRGDCDGSTAFLLRLVHAQLPAARVAIAVSGGVDSMALLHAALTAARAASIDVCVFHVHHGLQSGADDWSAHVRGFCKNQHVVFDERRLDASTLVSPQSIEDWARRGRYAALIDMAQAHDVAEVWLAQHEDDQIETHLLQAARGAGARGLSAMPQRFVKHAVAFRRPWLAEVRRADTEAYAAEHAVPFCHDPSNDDVRFARNALRAKLRTEPLDDVQRAEILNTITAAQQQNARENAWASAELARHRAAHRAEIGELSRLTHLDLTVYDAAQQALLLRAWFAELGMAMPSRSALNELIKQLCSARVDQHMCWRHPDGFGIARFQNFVVAARLLPLGEWFLNDELRAWVAAHGYELHARSGGERVRLSTARPSFSLKDVYQKMSVPPMLRPQLPLIYEGERLVHVVGVGDVV